MNMATKAKHESIFDRLPGTIQAGLVIIGNEVLSGRTPDKNVAWIAEKLDAVGVQLAQVRIVPDSETDIVEAVNALRGRYRYVFTTGGIGPTHDDITPTSIAKAFGRLMERNTEALKRLRAYYKPEDFTDARQRMADMPRDVILIDNPVSAAPGFIVENVYVMAGVPTIMQAMFEGIVGDLKGGTPLKTKSIQTDLREGQIAMPLARIQERNPKVVIGSYPFFKEADVGVTIVLRSPDEFALQKAAQEVRAMIDDVGMHSTSKAL
jgi:molybdenum cofactor synthesis domain-containing protein